MARSVAADGVRPGMNPRTASIIANYLEVLARVVYAQPQSLPALLEGSTAKLHAFVYYWLSLAAFRWGFQLTEAIMPWTQENCMHSHSRRQRKLFAHVHAFPAPACQVC